MCECPYQGRVQNFSGGGGGDDVRAIYSRLYILIGMPRKPL